MVLWCLYAHSAGPRCKCGADLVHLIPSMLILSYSDFGYYRPENSSECVGQEEMKRRPLEFCLNGTVEQLQTSG